MSLSGLRMKMERIEMKNELKLVSEGHSLKQWETIVLEYNQYTDKTKPGWRIEGVKLELKTKNLEGILKRGRSTRKTHVDTI